MVFSMNSCQKDYLDKTPSYSFSSENVWQSPILARAALVGLYNVQYQHYSYNNTGGTLGMPLETYSSVMDVDANWKGACIISSELVPSNGNLTQHYKYYYAVVYRANDVINNIDQVTDYGMDKSEAAEIKAEAKFMRAWAYYYLNSLWGGVPLYLENVDAQDAVLPRSSATEVWNQVITDLTEAIADLPAKVAGGETASQGAAYTLRGIVYQTLGDWSKALADFEKVGTLGYALYAPSNGAPGNDDYYQMLRPANEKSSEMIWALACMRTTNMGNPFSINYGNRSTGGSAWNNYLPNPAFVERYEEADGSQFNWEDYCPGYTSMTPTERSVFFLRDGLDSGNGEFGTRDYKASRSQMVEFGSDMSKYLDQGNEARIMKAYADRDPRLMMSIITPYSLYKGNTSATGNQDFHLRWPYVFETEEPFDVRTDTNSMFYYLWRKYVTEYDECTTRWVYEQNIIFFRYAEVLLRRAECLVELNRLDEAKTLIDQVRKRAGHIQLSDPACKTKQSTQAEMRDLVRNEMYVELGGEHSMYLNELRWGTWMDEKYNNNTLRAQGKPYNTGKNNNNGLMEMWGVCKYNFSTAGAHTVLWPFPAKEREMNPAITQNPGYTD